MTHTTLSAALEAREIWMRFTGVNPDTISGDDIRTAMECKNKMLDATPDALDWTAKALPWMKAYEQHLIMANLHGYNYDTAPLTALIAQAEGVK